MKTNVTVKLDSELLRQVRIIAAEKGSSISGLLVSQLEEIVKKRSTYEESKKRALERLRNCKDHGWVRPASRDELYER